MLKVGTSTTISWHNAEGVRLIKRHELNCRNQCQTKLSYVSSIKRHGIIQGARGEPWMVLPKSHKINQDAYEAISYGHLWASQCLRSVRLASQVHHASCEAIFE